MRLMPGEYGHWTFEIKLENLQRRSGGSGEDKNPVFLLGILNISPIAWQLHLLCFPGPKLSCEHITSYIRLSVCFVCSVCLQLNFASFTLHYTTVILISP